MATSDTLRIAVVVGSNRPGRHADQVAEWLMDIARRRDTPEVEYRVVDLADDLLPLLDEELPPMAASYANEHTQRWAATVDRFDGFVFVTPEYNHSFPAVLKNAVDYLYAEWNDKAAAFVSYGVAGGTRAAEQLRLVLAEVKVASVRSQVALTLSTDFAGGDGAGPAACTPGEHQYAAADRMLDELIAWSEALKRLRMEAASEQALVRNR
jgi:NAD(P)H-dependent FMN reductase